MTAFYETFKLLIGRFYSFVIGLEDGNWLGIAIKAFIVTSIVLIVLWVIPLTRKIAGHLGACQGSCRFIYAAKGAISFCAICALITQSFSGLRVTGPITDQSRVFPDHLAG